MGWLNNLVGSGADPIESVGKTLDELFTSDDERNQARIIFAKLQTEINKVEAGHRTIFVAGWRPYIGWVCGTALGWHFIVYDIVNWICATWYPHVAPPELASTESLMVLVTSLLGLGGMRTFEKYNGKAK